MGFTTPTSRGGHRHKGQAGSLQLLSSANNLKEGHGVTPVGDEGSHGLAKVKGAATTVPAHANHTLSTHPAPAQEGWELVEGRGGVHRCHT
jgi:hypothetical protein